METLLVLTYASICWIAFKVFKIKVNQWSLTTAVLGGVILLGLTVMTMAYFHPASQVARSYFVTTPIVPNVRGIITKVHAQANVPLKKGDILFEIDKTPFQATYDDINAKLKFAQLRLEESIKLEKHAGGSKFDVEKYEKDVSTLKAQLADAKFDLDSTIVRAPANGFVTQVRAKEGLMAVPLPLLPSMSFVNTDETFLVAGFEQQPMQNIKPGLKGEIIFDTIPGKTFQVQVKRIMPVLSEGEMLASKTLVSMSTQFVKGKVPVIIEVIDDMSEYQVPIGSDAVVAIYNHEGFVHHVAIIRKVLLRMESWRQFLVFH